LRKVYILILGTPKKGEIMEITLAELMPGKTGTVVRIMGGFGFRRRVEGMGIREGARVKKISSQPFCGPVIVEVNRSCIALGRGIASRIIVEV